MTLVAELSNTPSSENKWYTVTLPILMLYFINFNVLAFTKWELFSQGPYHIYFINITPKSSGI